MSPAPQVRVVRTGTANLASVLAGLRRAGADPVVTSSAEELREAPIAVLPGVGAFAAAMTELERGDLVEPLRERLQAGRPTLCVCLGLHLLAEESAESPGVQGLGVLPVRVRRFTDEVRVPQLGWNELRADEGCELLQAGHVYFANSFRLYEVPAGWSAAWSDHGGPFVAAIERGSILACQFHPELSGQVGAELLSRWVERARTSC